MQTVSGTVYDVNGIHRQVDCAPRLALCRELIEEAGAKVIVYVPFTGNLKFLEEELGKHYTVASVNGATSVPMRNRIFQQFQNDPEPRVLVAHPGCMSHGLTLTAANTIVWWAPVNSNDTYNQANGRIDRISQTNKMNIIHIAATAVERDVYKRLKEKTKLQNVLLDAIRLQTT
jgi:SNF2 family DNA or RNA helicase